nr:glutathione S-transferase sigma 5 [Brachionus rubens]
MNGNGIKFKLIYFEDRGKADLIKLLFAYSNQSYEDVQIKPLEWNFYKSLMPFEQLPVLIVNDEIKIAQAITIARYLANKLNLNGSNDTESILCDMVVEQLRECGDYATQIMQEIDINKRNLMTQKFSNDILTKTLNGFEKMLSVNSGKYIVGNKITWADLALVNGLEWLDELGKQILNYYPFVKMHNEYIRNIPQVNEWFRLQKPLRVFKKA